MPEQESVIMRRAIDGDGEALELLLEAHFGRLEQYVCRNIPAEIRSSIEPSDIVQETFYEACRLITGFDPAGEDAFFRWLATIARHHMIDLLRMNRSRRTRTVDGGDEDHDVVVVLDQLSVYRRTPSRSAAAHEFMVAVEMAIGRLPADYRKAVTLRHLEGLSVEESAKQMQRSPDAVYWLCSRGLKALRADLRSASQFQ